MIASMAAAARAVACASVFSLDRLLSGDHSPRGILRGDLLAEQLEEPLGVRRSGRLVLVAKIGKDRFRDRA